MSVAKEWETELKLYFLDEERWSEIFASSVVTRLAVSPPAVDQLEAQYFDTAGNSLQKAGIAYRIRREKGQWVAAVKYGGSSNSGLHQRQEWNVLIDKPLPKGDYFQGTTIEKPLYDALGQEELIPQYCTRFERQYVNLRTEDGGLVELAADRGEIVVGEKKEPICEIELEVKEGKNDIILTLGAELANEFPLVPEWRSKYYRALLLAGKAEKEGRKMLRISEHEPAAEGLTQLIVDRMHWLFASELYCLSQSAPPEGIAAFGEALASLIVLLELGQHLCAEEECKAAYNELLLIKKQLDGLCSIDRSITAWHEVMINNPLEIQGNPVLEKRLTENRDKKAGLLLKQLTVSKSTGSLLALWRTLLDVERPVTKEEEAASVSFGSIVQQRANTWLGDTEVCKKQPSFEDEKTVALLYDHCSRLRNALAAISVGGAKVRRMLPRAQKALESLGSLYDYFALQNLLKEMLLTNSNRLMYRDTGLLTGWQGHKTYKTRLKAAKRWKKLRQLIRFWIG